MVCQNGTSSNLIALQHTYIAYHTIRHQSRHWAILEKIPTGKEGRVENMEFPGVLKKKHVAIPGVN